MGVRELLRGDEIAKVTIHNEFLGDISHLTFDSREVQDGSCFFAVRGTASDGHDYIDMAINKGARVVVCETLPSSLRSDICYCQSDDVNRTLGVMSANFFGNPSREINLVGITGTNGKTTTATLLCDLFKLLGYKTGLISTVTYRVGTKSYPSTHTTPDAIRLNRMLREMVDLGCEYCFMEVSSHSIVQRRIEALEFRGAIFSNLTHDHLDYHGTFADYLRAKQQLFSALPKKAFALTNIDDRNGEIMVQNCRAEIHRYSLRQMAEFRARVIEMQIDGMLLEINRSQLWAQILGKFNAYNLLAAYATASLLGVDKQEILVAISRLQPVSGRFQHFTASSRTIIIDYAHTPDALQNVLLTIGEIRQPNQSIITICGCGGDRDRSKRSEMARIALNSSDRVIYTSDNPRTEDPTQILAEMIEGIKTCNAAGKWLKITDREEAIATAISISKAGDIILIAGKGHETYQIIGTTKHHFSDEEVARKYL